MPLYEYECDNCGHRTEVIQRVGAPPLGPCSECGGEVKKLLSAPAFQFKGTGWYVTDYAKKSGVAASESDGGKKESDAQKDTAKKDAAKRDAAGSGGKKKDD